MRAIAAFLIAFSLVALTIAPASAASDKTLQNVKGSVAYSTAAGGAETPIAPKSSIALDDHYTAVTGANSQGAIGLPDSSRVLVGQNTRVTLNSFNQTDIAHASFEVVGKVRFTIQHPAGARADYTFHTGTTQIAVRGTEGDISFDPATGTLQVNCYELTDPMLPVQITFADGSVFTLNAGQALIAHLPLNPADPPHVQNVTRPLADNFSEFGPPAAAKLLGLLAKPWFATTGWILIVPLAIVITTSHHPTTATPDLPTTGQFPVGVNFKIHF